MTGCRRCQSERIAKMSAYCYDRCSVTVWEKDSSSDYVPRGIFIGGGDYIEFSWCLDCGQIQNKFPLRKTSLEEMEEEADANMDEDPDEGDED